MGVEVIIIFVAVIAVVAVGSAIGVVVSKRRSQQTPPPPPPPPPPVPKVERPEPPPMTGLEDALNRATDRSGTTMADRLESKSDSVEDFRVTDDTGPLLRRALDRLHPTDEPTTDAAPAHAAPATESPGEGAADTGSAADDEPSES